MKDSIKQINSSNEITGTRAIGVAVYTISMVLGIGCIIIGGFFLLVVYWLIRDGKLNKEDFLLLLIFLIIFVEGIFLVIVSNKGFKGKIKEGNLSINTKEKPSGDKVFYSITEIIGIVVEIIGVGFIILGLSNLVIGADSLSTKNFNISILFILLGIIIFIVSLILFNGKKNKQPGQKTY